MARQKRTKKGAKRQTISATVTIEGKKQMYNAKLKLGATYADMIRHAVKKTYGITL